MTDQIKLTLLSSKAGWGCKIGPSDLAQVLRFLPPTKNNPNVLVGFEHSDDSGVYKLTDDIALVQTVDFFTPIVDDPYMFGQIAAANALSDVYAMGGTPKTVLNIVAFPIQKLGPEILADILQGSSDKVHEAGAEIIGGHSIDDEEPKFGLSVTGVVHPENFFKNIGAQPGDVLVLTKPIGVGIQTTALKQERLNAEQIDHVTNVMKTLNKSASESLQPFKPHAVTDVTGFGLLGHAYEVAYGSNVSFVIHNKKVPILPGTKALAEQNIVPGGSRANHQWLMEHVHYSDAISETEQLILCDAITSGGLLISMSKQEATAYIQQLKTNHAIDATIIGDVIEEEAKSVYIK